MSKTKKAFERIKKIWGGAKWSTFVRRWLGRRRTSAQRANYVFTGFVRRLLKKEDE